VGKSGRSDLSEENFILSLFI